LKFDGIARSLVAISVIVVVALAATGLVLLSQQSPSSVSQTGTTSTSSGGSSASTISTSVASLDINQAVINHLNDIHQRVVSTVLQGYTNSAVVSWVGTTRGLGGTYNGQDTIRLLFSSALGTAQQMNFSLPTVQQQPNTAGQRSANATFLFVGTSSILGNFSGSVSALITFQYSGSQWKISQETWNFRTFNVDNPGGMTTFPEWRTVGGPIVETRSPDQFKQFVWDFGGQGIMLLVLTYALSLVTIFIVKRWR